MKKIYYIPSFLCLTLMLTACGTASRSGSPPTAPPTTLLIPTLFPEQPGLTAEQEALRTEIADTPEFTDQWSLSKIGADYAYVRGYTGKGVTVGMIDSGADASHNALAERLHAMSGVAEECPDGDCTFSSILDTEIQGSSVAGVIAAAKMGKTMHGVAYEAQLLALGVKPDSSEAGYRPVDLSDAASFSGKDEINQGLYKRLKGNTKIVNHSYGLQGNVENYTGEQFLSAFSRSLESMLQTDTADADKMILVWAAGDSNSLQGENDVMADASSPDINAGLPHLFPALKGHFVTVVATQADGMIASYSNRCGVAAEFCIAAPGSDILGPAASTEDAYRKASSTALAAAQVSGTLALMEQAFRGQLGSTELVTRLLAAADKSGIYEDSETYGRGLLNVEKATRPIAITRIALSQALDGPSASLLRSAIAAGPAWGDALRRALAGRELAVFDSLNAPFFVPMEGFASERSLDQGLRLDRQFSAFVRRAWQPHAETRTVVGEWTMASALGLTNGLSSGAGSTQWSVPAVANAWVALGADGLGIARDLLSIGQRGRVRGGFFVQNSIATRGEQLTAPGRAQGALVSLEVDSDTRRFSAEAGLLRESERLLGAGAGGAYGQLAGNTWFTRLQAEQSLGGGVSLMAVAQSGYTLGDAGEGLLRGRQRVLSSAFSMGLGWKARRNSHLWLTLSQPLRNESGALELNYPTGRTRDGQVLQETALLSVQPSGRQLDLTLGYEAALPAAMDTGANWRIRLEASRSFQPGHLASAKPENTVFVAFSRGFNGRKN